MEASPHFEYTCIVCGRSRMGVFMANVFVCTGCHAAVRGLDRLLDKHGLCVKYRGETDSTPHTED